MYCSLYHNFEEILTLLTDELTLLLRTIYILSKVWKGYVHVDKINCYVVNLTSVDFLNQIFLHLEKITFTDLTMFEAIFTYHFFVFFPSAAANESTRKRVVLYTVGEYLLLAAVSALQVLYIRRLFSKSVAYNRVWVASTILVCLFM